MLSKEQILKASDREFEDVEVPEWGGSVRLIVMSGKERDRYEASLIKVVNGKPEQDLSNLATKLVSCCLVDEENKPMFTVEELGDKSGAVINRLFEKANALNMTAFNSVKEAAKN